MELIMLSVAIFAFGILCLFVHLLVGICSLFTSPKENCVHCGRPFRCFTSAIRPLCKKCKKAYRKALAAEIKRQPTTIKCSKCSGIGKIKGYKCTTCNGVGTNPRDEHNIFQSAEAILKESPLWKSFFEPEAKNTSLHSQTHFVEKLFSDTKTENVSQKKGLKE